MTSRSFLTSDGVKLALHERGHGPYDFVFQHGLCGAAAQPSEVTPDLSEIRLLTLECRGHGASEAGDIKRFSIAQFADDVASMIDERGEPVILGGISMGAAIALRLAVTKPQSVRALVLARPAWVTEPSPANMMPNAVVGELLAQYDGGEAQSRFMQSDIARRLQQDAPDNLQSLNGFFNRMPRDVTAALLMRISADGPKIARTSLADIRVPTLIIGHADDLIHPLSYAQELAGLIPHAELAIITSKVRDKGHYISDFQASLSRFIKKVCHANAVV